MVDHGSTMVDHGRPWSTTADRPIDRSTDGPMGRWADLPIDRSADRPVGDFQKDFYFMGGRVHIHDEFISNYFHSLIWQRSICLLFWTPAWEAPGQNFYSGSKCFYSDTDAAAAGAAVEAAAGATAATAACIYDLVRGWGFAPPPSK